MLNNKLDFYYIDNTINKSILDDKCTFNNFKQVEFEEELFKCDNDRVCVSLSGGVDSVLLLYYLKYLGKKVYAFNINYSNRDTSDDESNMCINICNYLNIPIYVRKINEITRCR